jgi:hypothetical protein
VFTPRRQNDTATNQNRQLEPVLLAEKPPRSTSNFNSSPNPLPFWVARYQPSAAPHKNDYRTAEVTDLHEAV